MTAIWTIALGGTTAGLSLAAGLAFFKWALSFAAGRADKREEQIDAGTKRLIEQYLSEVKRLTERLSIVETDLAECKRLHAESEARWLRSEAAQLGLGDARNHAQLIVADEKRKANEANKQKDGGK